MKIGNIEIKNNIFLAPMAGITDVTFRKICKSYGAGVTVTEMVSAKGLYYKDKKTASLMELDDSEVPAAIQIFGSDPKIMAEIAPRVEEMGVSFIDINMGCPTPKIVNNGDGSALMKNPELAGEIVYQVSKAVSVPVTVKIRKGWQEENAVEMARILEEGGAKAITVHGRTKEQFYSGKADWDTIKRVKDAVNIPVVGNGDIWSATDAVDMIKYTGCDGVMVGRGSEGNPFIFRQIKELFEEGEVKYFPSNKEKLEVAFRHTKMLVENKGEVRGIKEARKHISWYIKGMKDSSQVKAEVFRATTLAEIEGLLNGMLL